MDVNIKHVTSERGGRYGDYASHAKVTQEIKLAMQRAYDEAHADRKYTNLPYHVRESLDMIAHKLGRIVNGDAMYKDSWVDIAGYASLTAERLKDE